MFEGHLHVHTEYSMLDGMSKIEDLIIKAKEYGQKGIAITDHGSSSGLYEAWKLGKKHNFNVLLGEEFYFENSIAELKTGHLILIAKNETGLRNIFRLQKLAYDNIYYKPRINMEMLKQHNEGLICTTACIANAIGQLILRDETVLALNHIIELKNIFKDDLYIEFQSSTNKEVLKVNEVLERFINSNNLNCIVTTDIHYLEKNDYSVHEVLLAMQQKTKMNNPKRWKFEYNDYWLKTEDEMKKDLNISEDTWIKCCNGIHDVFEKCKDVNFEIEDHLPKMFETREQEDEELYKLAYEGFNNKVKNRKEATIQFANDIEKELKVISEEGYSGYFLVVREYVNWARENNILVGDGRGSGAGSKVAYSIGITDINPEKYDLLFERFMAHGRTPDFDVDFSDIDAVFRHLQDVYGEENVARVGAYTRLTAKSATIKVLSTFGYSTKEIKNITELMPDELQFSFDDALTRNEKLRSFFNEHEDLKYIIKKLEGITEHASTHAGGVIICKDLSYMLPVIKRADDAGKMIIAMDKHELEELGHYKFDILGLSSLTMMKNITDFAEVDWNTVDYDDQNIYEMLCKGNLTGIFQLSDQKDKTMEMQPRCFNDLIAINALIRPGVCDWKKFIKARFENEGNIFSDISYMKQTHGLIVYQEQYELLAQTFAGWDIAFSDKHIRKNKNLKNDEELKNKFINDGKDLGNEEELLSSVWKEIVDVAAQGYSFNKSHAASYAVLSFRTAYMKYYYPKEFYAGYLTQYLGKPERLNEGISELKNLGIRLINPTINNTESRFTPTKDGIRLPITSVKSVGGSVLYEINRLKPITSFEDFMKRRIPKFVKSTALEALIKAGAFDFDNPDRYGLLCSWKEEYSTESKKENYVYENEAFGFYLNETPFEKYNIKQFDNFKDGEIVMTIGQLTELKVRQDKRGQDMAFGTIVNQYDTIKIIIFASVWKKLTIEEGKIVFVKGKKDKTSILVNTMEVLDE